MCKNSITEGMLVYDRWWPHNIGIVSRIFKKSIHVKFGYDTVIYDLDHIQFLEEAYKSKPATR